jgi:hypothetical protein
VYYHPAPVACYPPVRYEPVKYYCPPVRYYEAPVAAHAPYYWDPYCNERFTSLSIYFAHVRQHGHASVALEFQIGDRVPAYACRYVEDRWLRFQYASN